MKPVEQASEVERFFTQQWALYRKVVDGDYMRHRLFGPVVADTLSKVKSPFGILDMGCGDGAFLGAALEGTKVRAWEGVDLSARALDSARQIMAGRPWKVEFRQVDLIQRLRQEVPRVVFSGHVFHHLSRDEKGLCFGKLARALPPGGEFLLLDLVRPTGESREAYLQRFHRHVDCDWKTLSAEEKERVRLHMSDCDFPECMDELDTLAREAGFARRRVLCRDEREFFALLLLRR